MIKFGIPRNRVLQTLVLQAQVGLVAVRKLGILLVEVVRRGVRLRGAGQTEIKLDCLERLARGKAAMSHPLSHTDVANGLSTERDAIFLRRCPSKPMF
jgi:hypothetical protein